MLEEERYSIMRKKLISKYRDFKLMIRILSAWIMFREVFMRFRILSGHYYYYNY